MTKSELIERLELIKNKLIPHSAERARLALVIDDLKDERVTDDCDVIQVEAMTINYRKY